MYGLSTFLVRAINFLLSATLLVLVARILFRLLAANPATPLVSTAYAISDALVSPFEGVLASPIIGDRTFDIPAVISAIAYILLAYLTIALIHSIVKTTEEVQRHGHI